MYSHPRNSKQGSGGKELTSAKRSPLKRAAPAPSSSHVTPNPPPSPGAAALILLNLGIILDLANAVKSGVG